MDTWCGLFFADRMLNYIFKKNWNSDIQYKLAENENWHTCTKIVLDMYVEIVFLMLLGMILLLLQVVMVMLNFGRKMKRRELSLSSTSEVT